MTRGDIIRLAREAGFAGWLAETPFVTASFERFAALVAAAERDRMIAEGWRQCAEGQSTTQFCATAHKQAYLDGVNSGIKAAAIRARGEP
jgi:hypothetical protein